MHRHTLFKIDAFTPTIYWSLCASVVIAHWYRWPQIALCREQPAAKCTRVAYFLLTIEEAKHVIFSCFTSQYLDQFFLWVSVTLRPGRLQPCKVHGNLDKNFCLCCTSVFWQVGKGFGWILGPTRGWELWPCSSGWSDASPLFQKTWSQPNGWKFIPISTHTAALAGNWNVTRAAFVPSASPHPRGHLSIILPVPRWKIRQTRLWWNWVRLYETASGFKHEGGLRLWYAEIKPCKI